jgi:excinuclease UvrABC nuclease subunit
MQYEFTSKNVDHAPDKPGVYALYYGDEIIYYGWAQGDTVTIRSRLQSHKSGREGACTEKATHYRREVTDNAEEREKQLLLEYRQQHGRLPRCNAKIGLSAIPPDHAPT